MQWGPGRRFQADAADCVDYRFDRLAVSAIGDALAAACHAAMAHFDDNHPRLSEETISLLSVIDFGKFVTDINTWIGIVVCGLLTTAAIYVRRYRDES